MGVEFSLLFEVLGSPRTDPGSAPVNNRFSMVVHACKHGSDLSSLAFLTFSLSNFTDNF